jgi:hypothetical protein
VGIKNAKFDADFESGEKVAKISTGKVMNMKVNQFCCFSSFSTVGKSSKPYNFFPVTFPPTFSMDSKSASNSGFFDTHSER